MSSLTVNQAASEQSWDSYVSRAAGASLYHLHGWKGVVERTFGHRTFYLAASREGAGIVGVLPLVQLKSRIFGNLLVSMPFFNYGGICADEPDVRQHLLGAAVDVAHEVGADSIELRHQDDWDQGLPRKTHKVSMHLALPATADELWKGLGAKLRNQVQKPRKEGLTVTVGRGDQLDAFYEVFSANMRDLGTPVYPKAFFAAILQSFPSQTWIVTVYQGSQPVASGFLAGFRERLEIPWASSLRAFNRSSPNMLLYWRCLELACEQGFAVFDFGRSSVGENTYKFKEQWGAKPHQLYWYYWLPDGRPVPEVNPKNPKFQAAIAIWQKLPLGLTRQLGPHIVKYIP